MAEKEILGHTVKEWIGLLVSLLFLMIPVNAMFFENVDLWKKMILMLFLVGWFGLVLYCLLYGTRSVRKLGKEEEVLNSIEKYLKKKLWRMGYSDDCADEIGIICDEVMESLREWQRLPKEVKYNRHYLM
jgi:hypothetical protein